MKIRKLSLAGLAALNLTVAAGVATALHAAETAAPAEELAEVAITGSRLRGAAPVGSAIIALGREEITASSAPTVDRLIQELPQIFDLGVSENSRGQPGGAGNIVYSNAINIRGIGANATLTLIDGHRATSNGRSVNPSVIPTLGLERIEVVADGASGVYGSDAIAGVVNLIPRRSLNGGEVSARYGRSDDGNFDEYSAGFAFGKVWDKSQLMLAYEHVYRSNLNGDDRDFFAGDQRPFGGRDYRVTRCSPGTIRAGTSTYAIPAAGVTQATVAALVAGTVNSCNGTIGQDLFPEQEYDSLNTTASHDVTDWLTVFFDGFYSNRDYVRTPAYANASFTVPQTNAFFVRPAGFTGTSYTIDYNYLGDLPQDVQTGFARSWEFTPGLRIKLPHDWQLETLWTHGNTRDAANQTRGVNGTFLTTALASADPAIAFDPYGLHRTSAATLATLANQVFIAPTKGRFNGYELRLNGSVLTLPGGEAKLAAGYEGQQIGVDLGSQRGAPTTPLVYRTFTRRVDSAYAELQVPVFGAGNAMTGLRKLDINIAVRYDKYDDVGNTTNPKFGLNWSPIDTLTLRGSYGESFRAPLIAEIYGNSNNLFNQQYQNPAGGATIPGVALSGANLDLKPETAKTWSVGLDWDALDNLRFSLTRFNINYKNQVNAYLSDLAILSREAQFAGTGIILRGTAARDRVLQLLSQGVLPSGTFPGNDANNVTLFIDGRNQNLGRSITTGYDFQGTYKLATDRFGNFSFNLGGTYFSKYEVAITEAAPLIDRLNQIYNPLKLKARAAVTWDKQALRVQLVASRVGSYDNNLVTPTETVDAYTPVDLTVGYTFGAANSSSFLGGPFTVTLDARNLFDTDPSYVNVAPNGNGSGGYDASIGNPVGRELGIAIRKKW